MFKLCILKYIQYNITISIITVVSSPKLLKVLTLFTFLTQFDLTILFLFQN